MSADIAFQVYGSPAPQGSKKGFQHPSTGRVIVVEQQSRRVRSWRDDVKTAALQAMCAEVTQTDWEPMSGPIHILVVFQLTRPKNHYRTGRNASLLRDDAPRYPAKMPDLDKLERATYDAITSVGLWKDDGQIVMAEVSKVWSATGTAGAFIRVTDLDRLNAATSIAIEDVAVAGELL